MSQTPTQDTLSGIPAQSSTTDTAVTPFTAATISGTNDDTDVVTCYVLNDNAAAGVLDASKLPANSCIAPAGGTLVMISGSMATVQTALRALLFQPAALAAGSTANAHLTVVMSNVADGVSSQRAISSEMVQSVGANVALTGLPAAASTIADTQPAVLMPKLAVLSAAADGVQVKVSLGDASLGELDAGGLSGLAVSVTTNADGSVTLSGSASVVTGGLDALRFAPQPLVNGMTGKEVFTIAASDTVNGSTASGSFNWSIAGSLPAITLSGVATSAAISGGESTTLFSSMSMQDRVSGDVTATVTLASPGAGRFAPDQLPLGVAVGVTDTLSGDGSVVTLTGAASAVQTDLQALRFVSTNPASGTVSTTVTLDVATAANGSTSATEQVAVASSGTAPVLSGNATVTATGAATLLYPDVTLTGPTTAVSATVSLSDISTAGFNQTAFRQAETGNTAISYVFSTDGTRLTVNGATAAVGAALRSVAVQASTPATAVQSREVATLSLQADAGNTSYATDILVDGPALQADSATGVPSSATVTTGTTFAPFAQATIVDRNVGDIVSVVVTSSVAGLFAAASLPSGASLSPDGATVTLSGSASAVQAALRSVAVTAPLSGAGSVIQLTEQLSNQAGGTSLSAATTIEAVTFTAPAYSSDTGSNQNGRVFSVSGDPSQTASIDLSADQAKNIVVFGGKAALSLTAANATVVLNGAGQTGAVSIRSLGGNVVWVGAAPVDCVAGGHDRFILGAGDQSNETVTVHGGTAADTSEFDVWATGSGLQTITTDGVCTSTVFSGGAALDFTGGNATVVLNGAGQTGAVAVHSLGGDTVWAGMAGLDFFEGAGNDTVILSGAASTTIHGAAAGQTGTTTVMSFGNQGAFTYDGGGKAAILQLAGGTNLVQGGAAAQRVTMSGGGSLEISDGASASGAQQITMAQSSTASLRFLGGGNPATLVLGAGAATITAGNHASVTGGSGSASVDLSDAIGAALSFDGSIAGNLDVMGFDPSRGSVQLSHVAASSVQGGSLVVAFTDGAHATFHGYAGASHAGIAFG